jgi:hypothetical protein
MGGFTVFIIISLGITAFTAERKQWWLIALVIVMALHWVYLIASMLIPRIQATLSHHPVIPKDHGPRQCAHYQSTQYRCTAAT